MPSRTNQKGLLAHEELAPGPIHWRWIAVAALCGAELFALALTVFTARLDDDWLILTVPLNTVLVTAAAIVAGLGNPRLASRILCGLHLIGLGLATIFAAVEIESVVVSGVLVSASGIAVAVVGERFQVARIVLGLSTVIFALVAFLVIAIGNYGPYEADAPLFTAMVAYQVVFVPLGLYVLRTSFLAGASAPRFGLATLLLGTLLICVATAGGRLALSLDAAPQVALAVSLFLLTVAAVVIVTVLSRRQTGQLTDAPPCGGGKLSCS